MSGSAVFEGKKQDFLSNKENKQKFITLLDGDLQHGSRTQHARGDADFLIVRTSTATDQNTDTLIVVVADNTDILVLLCYYSKMSMSNLYLRPEPLYGMKKQPRC